MPTLFTPLAVPDDVRDLTTDDVFEYFDELVRVVGVRTELQGLLMTTVTVRHLTGPFVGTGDHQYVVLTGTAILRWEEKDVPRGSRIVA